ncbi:type VI secretion system ATPase TssH [Corallincola platygyrae]|uniref:Type VI secretion system ATPase TssH n=2 Tax=Corallincola platygyrae TaxID=1193278 RepID=A0ABW4XMD8_9GAMM
MTLKSLVEKLEPNARRSLELAAASSHSLSHESVEISHWWQAILNQGLLDNVFDALGVEKGVLLADATQQLERVKTGYNATPGLSTNLVSWLRASWLNCSLVFGDTHIRAGHLFHTLLTDDSTASNAAYLIRLFDGVSPESIKTAIENEGVSENIETPASSSTQAPMLEQYTTDLTAAARSGKIDPVIGREIEIRQMIDILARRRQNNPLLTGEPGVGKTAVVEGLALKIANDEVPEAIQNVRLLSLDLALLQAGAGVKGEFENRLKSIIKEVGQQQTPVILFIDEAHTLIGSGGAAGQNDAANILKPALARGELKTIAATTWAEYKKYFEKDAALSRRFQVINVLEPAPDMAVRMLRGIASSMTTHHGVFIDDEALKSAVHLSKRYLPSRQLPDKAIALLDTACARVAMSQNAVPASIEVLAKECEHLKIELEALTKEQQLGEDHHQRIAEITELLAQKSITLNSKESQWRDEKGICDQISQTSTKLLSTDDTEEKASLKAQLLELKSKASTSEEQLVDSHVSRETVARILSDWTGIPLGRMQSDEFSILMGLSDSLKQRVVGQDHAVDLIAKVIQTARAQLSDERRPNGVFMLAGPSGVGKTETALAVAERVYGSEDALTVINMSEFKEEHKVSLLLGSPPGYVGFGEGGILTEAVRRRPYSVVLLDEMEKAHPGVQDIFYQAFDRGVIKDGEGRDIDFSNTIVMMTSNLGADTTLQLCADPATAPTPDGLIKALQEDLLSYFKPAFLGRVNTVPYYPLGAEQMRRILSMQFNNLSFRLMEHHGASLKVDDTVYRYVLDRCGDIKTGARNIIQFIQNHLLPLVSEKVLMAISEKVDVLSVELTITEGELCANIS